MTPRQYRNALAKLDLTHDEATRRLRIGLRTSMRWSAGDGPIPWSIELVLRYWLETGVPPEEVTRRPMEELTKEAILSV